MKATDLATCFKQRHDSLNNDDRKIPVTKLASHNTHSHINAHTQINTAHTPPAALDGVIWIVRNSHRPYFEE